MPDHRLTLTVPASADMFLVVRMALSGLCVTCGLGLDAVETLRVASDEACYCLLHQPRPAQRLELCCAWTERTVQAEFRAERAPEPAAQPMERLNPVLAQSILETLVPDVALEYDEGGVWAIRLTVCCQDAP